MARDYNGTSKKARVSIKNKARPVEGGAVAHSKPTPFENQQKVNATKEEIKEGKRVTPAEYDKDYYQRGYYPARTGEVRVLEQLSNHTDDRGVTREPMYKQLSGANKRNLKR